MPYVRKVMWETKNGKECLWMYLRDHTQYTQVAFNLRTHPAVGKFWKEDIWVDKEIDWEDKSCKIFL